MPRNEIKTLVIGGPKNVKIERFLKSRMRLNIGGGRRREDSGKVHIGHVRRPLLAANSCVLEQPSPGGREGGRERRKGGEINFIYHESILYFPLKPRPATSATKLQTNLLKIMV